MDDKEFLLKLREYIENSEEFRESESGLGRTAEQLTASKAMPDVYWEVLRRLEL